MVTWTTELPDTATVGDAGHVADHNAIVAAISETRDAVDANEAALGDKVSGPLPSASTTTPGIVELATPGETSTGTDTARAVTPAGVKAVADTKASAADLASLVSRVEALEAAASG